MAPHHEIAAIAADQALTGVPPFELAPVLDAASGPLFGAAPSSVRFGDDLPQQSGRAPVVQVRRLAQSIRGVGHLTSPEAARPGDGAVADGTQDQVVVAHRQPLRFDGVTIPENGPRVALRDQVFGQGAR